MILAPSVLAADFGRLADHCREALEAGADWLHIDVMDGHFVPNISFGAPVMRGLRDLVEEFKVPLDVHLMIENADRYLQDFAEAGAAIITVHQEATTHLNRSIGAIKELGCQAGVALNPATPVGTLEEVASDVDLVLLMSVNPGFGGQAFIEATVDKTRRTKQLLRGCRSRALIEIDGGVGPSNTKALVEAGADVLVAGSSVFRGDVQVNISAIRDALTVYA